MMRPVIAITVCVAAAGVLFGQADPAEVDAPSPSFGAVHVYIDSGGHALAAYQLEAASDGAGVKIVGIEGGEHPAYRQPPYYDPAAMQHDRVILAAFSANQAGDLPRGRTRLATIHYMSETGAPARFAAKLITAADAQRQRIAPTLTLESAGDVP